MFAKLIAKFGRRIVMWAVVAIAGAAARKAMEAWAQRGSDPAAGASSAV
jgi:hypothetical protein